MRHEITCWAASITALSPKHVFFATYTFNRDLVDREER